MMGCPTNRKNIDELKILLLQIRDNHTVRREEHESFAKFTGLRIDQIEICNVFDTPEFTPSVVDGYDALFVGGASEASVLEPENYPFLDHSQALLRYSLEKSIPVFASCFGFQLAVVALGGEVIRDQSGFEMGTVPISLTALATEDPLFHDILNEFHGVSVHRERAVTLPENCELLAYTDQCCHSFRVKDKPFWAFQFHPEVDRACLVERLTVYKEHYTEGDDHLEAVLSSTVETPESNNLLQKFVERVVATQPTEALVVH